MTVHTQHVTIEPYLRLCSHLTSAFASTPPSKFNIASMVTQTQRMGLNPLSASTFRLLFIMLSFDGDANTDVKCEQA